MIPTLDKSILRWVIAAAIGLVVGVSTLLALSGSGRGDQATQQAAYIAAIGQGGTTAISAIDQGLSSMAPRAAAIPLDPQAAQGRFARLSRDFFQRTDDVKSLVLFRSAPTREDASQLARGVSEGIVEFRAGGKVFYLAPADIAMAEGGKPGTFPLVGSGGRLPQALAAGQEMQRALGTSIARNAPTSSQFFGWDGGAVTVVPATHLGDSGERVFWRVTPVQALDPATGREVLTGAVAALVDARALLSRIAAAPATLTGPFDRVALPDGIRDGQSAGTRSIGIPTGEQGFMATVPVETAGASSSSMFAKIIGLLMAGVTGFAVLFVSQQEAKARKEAEQRLNKNRRVFKKRSIELKRSEERFRRLAESTNVVPWAADLASQRFTYIGPQIAKITGYPVESWCASGFWVAHVHPEDRQRTFVDGFKGLDEGEYAVLEYRIRSADGQIIHIRNMLTISSKKDGSRIAQGYMLDISEMKTAQAKLDDARRQAEEANKTKSEFLANMSHELRTPLNAVIGFAEVMKDELFGPMGDRYKDYAESVHSSGKHLLELINDVLDLSKIEAGKIELIEEETDLGTLLSKCRTVLHERASSAGLHIRLEIPAPLPNIVVDSRRIKQVILNLMSNSIKFTMPGGRITLRGELKAPKGLVITIADTGIGMTKDELAIAFEQFGQIDNELSRNHSGTGLGLPITRSLIELHSGELEVESRKGVGTSAHVWIPLTRVVNLNGSKGVIEAEPEKEEAVG